MWSRLPHKGLDAFAAAVAYRLGGLCVPALKLASERVLDGAPHEGAVSAGRLDLLRAGCLPEWQPRLSEESLQKQCLELAAASVADFGLELGCILSTHVATGGSEAEMVAFLQQLFGRLTGSPSAPVVLGMVLDALVLVDPQNLDIVGEVAGVPGVRGAHKFTASLIAATIHAVPATALGERVHRTLQAASGVLRLDMATTYATMPRTWVSAGRGENRAGVSSATFSGEAILAIARLTLEDMGASADYEQTLQGRLPLLLHALSTLPTAEAMLAVERMQDELGARAASKGHLHRLLAEVYQAIPAAATQLTLEPAVTAAVVKHVTPLDVRLHRLVVALLETKPPEAQDAGSPGDRADMAYLTMRNLGARHPVAVLRCLPTIAAMLLGRASVTREQFLVRRYDVQFIHTLGIIDLVKDLLVPDGHLDPRVPDILAPFLELLGACGEPDARVSGLVGKLLELFAALTFRDAVGMTALLAPHLEALDATAAAFPGAVGEALVASVRLRRPSRDPKVVIPLSHLQHVQERLGTRGSLRSARGLCGTKVFAGVAQALRDVDSLSAVAPDVLR